MGQLGQTLGHHIAQAQAQVTAQQVAAAQQAISGSAVPVVTGAEPKELPPEAKAKRKTSKKS